VTGGRQFICSVDHATGSIGGPAAVCTLAHGRERRPAHTAASAFTQISAEVRIFRIISATILEIAYTAYLCSAVTDS
jgi:hypothetical protein